MLACRSLRRKLLPMLSRAHAAQLGLPGFGEDIERHDWHVRPAACPDGPRLRHCPAGSARACLDQRDRISDRRMVLLSRADYKLGCPLGPRRATMSFYEKWILPALIDLSMGNKRLRPYRERVAGAAEGRVLDVGIGSGLNLPFYAGQAREIFGLDPSPRLLARAQRQTQHMEIPFHLLEGSAERITLADRSMDTDRHDMDRLQHSRDQDCPHGHAARAQDRRAVAIRGAWTRAGTECRPLAGSPRSALAEVLGRVSPQPQDRRFA